jgi:UTP-glucose-1-phosphate uridylyltransferase
MVLLGDHVHRPAPGRPPPAAQVAAAFAARPCSAMVGVQVVDLSQAPLVGVCRGQPVEANLYRCTDIVEKPGAAEARRLVTPHLPPGRCLAHAGIYAFSGEIFDCLEALVRRRRGGEEVGLTEAQQMLLSRRGEDYFLCRIEGRTYDLGTPAGYASALTALASQGG